MFSEEYTFERLLEEVLDNAPEGIDTRPGSIFYDAVSGVLMKVAKLYVDIDMIAELVYIDTTSGEYLDRKASENGVTRMPATPARYAVTFGGAEPALGERFYTDGIYFVLKQDSEDEARYLEAEIAGTEANDIYAGTAAIPVNNIPGLTAATFGEPLELGAAEESDDDLRERLREKMSGPAENGNRQHYHTWCEEVDGVGRARIFPLWNGPNTVKGIIIDPNGLPAGPLVVERVQEYIDPDEDGDGEGDGLGEGVANLGAHFTAQAAVSFPLTVSFNVVPRAGETVETVKQQATEAIEEYLKDIALGTEDDEKAVLRISAVGAIINGLPSVIDYTDLQFNGDTHNIEVESDEVAVVEEVNVVVLQ